MVEKANHFCTGILYSIFFLFFLQLLSDFIEAIYAFGLLATSLTVEVASLLFLFSPAILLLRKTPLGNRPLLLIGYLILVCRVVEPLLNTRWKMLVAGLGVAGFLIFFPSLLRNQPKSSAETRAQIAGAGLILASGMSILFRSAGSGLDYSTFHWHQIIGWLLAITAAILLFAEMSTRRGCDVQASEKNGQQTAGASLKKVLPLCLGIISVFSLFYFAYAAPNVMSRWTGVDLAVIVSIMMFAIVVFSYFLIEGDKAATLLNPKTVLLWNVLFVISLTATLFMHQLNFPHDAGEFPIYTPPISLYKHIPLITTLLLFPILVIDFMLFVRQLTILQPPPRLVAGGFLVSTCYLFLLILGHIFTTVYDYIPVVGPLFRDKFWLVFLTPGLTLLLPLFWLKNDLFAGGRAANRAPLPRAWLGTIVLLSLLTILAIFLTRARPVLPVKNKTALRILTFNVQQGYDQNGQKNCDGQLRLIQKIDPDVIGLQETDSNRIAGGNSDLVRYFTDRLNLYSYYGPKTVTGTFGIALLSKYPIENPRTFFMHSVGEQTATITATISVQGKPFSVFVTHLGNQGPMVQQQAILKEVKGKRHLILMGDFNFKPASEQYVATTQNLRDALLQKWPQSLDKTSRHAEERIDHIFVMPDIEVMDTRYILNSESDHPAVVAEIKL
ncbi:MAG: endonuclease/exonuclease/phosphatase family protein [bacterium]